MRWLIKTTAFLLAVVMLAVPVLGQMGGGMGGGMMDDEMMRGKAKDMMIRGNEMRSSQGMMGMGFMHSQGSSYGNYVTFSVDTNTGAVMDYGILGVTVFDSIKVAGFNFKESKSEGALTGIINRDGSVVIQLHDNPASVINIGTKAAATVTFDLADGVKASKEDNMVKIEAGELTAFIVSTNTTSINIAGKEVRIEFNRGNAVFRALPVNMQMDGMNQRFMGEMMSNRAGAEVSVGISDKYSIVNYSENMNIMMGSINRNRMRMIINSTDPSGKFIIMNLDNSSMMWSQGQRIRLYLDNMPMRQVMTSDELYNARDSSFWLNMSGGNRMQAMMYIANFSERVVDIVVEEEGTPTPAGTPVKTPVPTPSTPGFEIVLGVLGAGLAYGLRRR
ncbi:MAG TPA: hypothetical protein VJJ51_10310 [Candidatus Methanoperedens sp.]|nr:hypothetical protein [Candidatus Methanoperedens sp.]HLB71423.1 hypothetical protein [Candidatus Methanoperedens sp.]